PAEEEAGATASPGKAIGRADEVPASTSKKLAPADCASFGSASVEPVFIVLSIPIRTPIFLHVAPDACIEKKGFAFPTASSLRWALLFNRQPLPSALGNVCRVADALQSRAGAHKSAAPRRDLGAAVFRMKEGNQPRWARAAKISSRNFC